jgi:glycosyltransferase involved in cell wall biosynthesis
METLPLKISIVTPSFNQGSFLERTIRSVLEQNDPRLQYIVVDGASEDDSPAILQKYADRLAWSVSEKDTGHANAINKGFSHTDGDIMAWLNSDDMYFPWTLQLVREVFERFPDVEWITGIPALWNSNDQLIENHNGKAYLNKWDFMGGRYQWIQQESTFWRRSLWERTGGRLDDSGILMIDGELWTRFFNHAELWRIETLLGGYRLHETNRAHSAADQVNEEMTSFCDSLRTHASDADKKTLDDYLKFLAETPTGLLHHPCSRYPVIHWSMDTNSWAKNIIYKRHEWTSATIQTPESDLETDESGHLVGIKKAYHTYSGHETDAYEESLLIPPDIGQEKPERSGNVEVLEKPHDPPTEQEGPESEIPESFPENELAADHEEFQETAPASPPRRNAKLRALAQSTGRPEWPYKAPEGAPIPTTLPNGRPWPRISIVTPSYNQGQYIEQTLLSVINQDYPNVEHIVMDGGSKDATVAVLEKYSPFLSFWVSEKDGGQSNAINKGFARATGEIVTWLNSDDLLAPGALAAMAMAFDTSGADMVAGICQLHRDGEIFGQHLTSCADGPLPLAELLDLENHWMAGQFFFQPEVFFKRDLLLKAGGKVNEDAHWSMDFELWVRFAQAGATLKVIGRPIVQFRVHDEQKTQDVAGFKHELQSLIGKIRPALGMPDAPPLLKGRKQKLKIVFFNDLGFRYGAGIGHQRLASAARMAGHEVIPISIGIDNLTDSEKDMPFEERIVPHLLSYAPDVVVLGNVHSASLSPACLKTLTEALPTVFVLHDSWLLTGRCAYRGGCNKNLTGCDESCPTSDEYPVLAPSRIASAWRGKMDLLQNSSKLVLAANSKWTRSQVAVLADALHAPAGDPVRRPHAIRLGVPLDVFRPLDPVSCREKLMLPRDKFILLFSCSNLADKRKGVDHLLEAIRKLDLPDLVPVCIGYNDGSTPLDLPNLISVGYLTDTEQQVMLYNAADLFVAPSLEEAFGQVFVEAAACGTPSVAYPVGGVPEALADGIVGRLAKLVDPDSLAEAIRELYLNHRLRTNLGWWGRCHVENEFSMEASSRSLFFALRDALRLAGADLVPKLNLEPKHEPLPRVIVLLEALGFINSDAAVLDRRFELGMVEYYQSQIVHYRSRPTPWWLKPKAWLARINRNNIRKTIARNDRKRKKRDNG